MKIDLKPVESLLKKVERNQERQQQLKEEQQLLQPRIKELIAAVGGGDIASCNPLQIAKARTEMLPAELDATKLEFDRIISDLRSALLEIPTALHEAYAAEYQRVERLAKKFLEEHLDSPHLVETLTREIVTNAKKLRALDAKKTVFGGSSINIPNAAQVLSKARYALENLNDV